LEYQKIPKDPKIITLARVECQGWQGKNRHVQFGILFVKEMKFKHPKLLNMYVRGGKGGCWKGRSEWRLQKRIV
jgi:hypothetical protein